MKEVKARPDPHPSTDEPEEADLKAMKAAMKAAQPPLPDMAASRKDSSLLKDAEWEASHSNAQKQAKQSLAESEHHDEEGLSAPIIEKEIPDKSTCDARSKSGQSELIPHDEYTKCNSEVQLSEPKKE